MAEKPLERESLTCPICLDLLSNPVTIPCGHSFCMRCIENSWRNDWDVYHCPQCRKRFSSKPVLNKNIMLADLVEQIVKTTPASDCYAGPQDVTCDVCTGRKLKAAKSCLQCVVSFCESHLQPHRDVAMLQKHQLVAPSNKLQENICHEHNEVKKMFCCTDLLSICVLCCMDQHKGHDTVYSADERALRQAEMEANIDQLKNRVHHKETDQNRLSENNHASGQSAKRAELYCTNTFTELIDILTNIQIEVNQHITSQLRTEKKLNNILRDKLRRESSDLTKTISELEELADTREHNHFLLLYPSAPLPPPDPTDAQPTSSESTAQQPTDTDSTSRLTRPPMDFDYAIKAVTAFREKFPLTLSDFKLPQPEVPLPTPEPVTRKALLCYRREMELDQNTAHSLMFVSDDDRRVTFVGKYPQHPDKFIYDQVLSKHGMIGRSYWEVQVSRAKFVCVAVSYKDFEGGNCTNECAFGNNDKSWALTCDDNKFSFCCNSVRLDIAGPAGPAVGVYLDYVAGLLSFYNVDRGIATLLHKVQTSFTRPVYAGLALRHHCDSAAFAKFKDDRR